MRYMAWCIFIGLCVGFSSLPIMAQDVANKDVGIVFKGDKVDIDINDMPLEKVLKAFKDAKGVSYDGAKSVLELKLTGKLKNASVENALKHILFKFDHGILYNKNGEVVYVRVVEKGKGETEIQPNDKMVFYESGSNLMEGEPKTEVFMVKKDVGPPGGPITYEPGEKERFIPKYNVPPSGGLPNHPALTNDQIKQNVPLPGGVPSLSPPPKEPLEKPE
jgi:hypothetical protein